MTATTVDQTVIELANCLVAGAITRGQANFCNRDREFLKQIAEEALRAAERVGHTITTEIRGGVLWAFLSA